MKPKERQAKIFEIVGRDGEVSVEGLADMFDISLETVRRDLQELASTGAVHKVRGGARKLKLHAEGSFRERMVENAEDKAVIAKKLEEIIEPGDTIFIDTGTTTLACAETLAAIDNLTIVTNSLDITRLLGEAPGKPRLFLLGGGYSAGNSQTVGPLALEQIRHFQADHAIITVAAVDAESGAMDADFDEAQIARAMIERARNTVLVAHSGKFGRRAAFRVCRLDEIDVLVSEQLPESGMASAFTKAGTELL